MLWAAVARTVRPAHGRVPVVEAPAEPKPTSKAEMKASVASTTGPELKLAPTPYWRQHLTPAPHAIEPNRKRRLTRERDEIEARIDLHGLGQFQAEDRLKLFLVRAQDMGLRAVLVITGKGVSGDGVIRRRAPEWLADPALRTVVAGVAQAHPRHGGDGALYVAIKRKAAI
ncbi:MAG TPA: Smr/MutS family protein [Caulobacteraceae bacterium]|nr:Smr/MutS family protein [Caulobacteraceae bacterium]